MATDKSEEWAEKVVERLLERGDLELVTRSTRATVESLLALVLEHKAPKASAIAARIVELKGVAELNCEDDELAKIIAAAEPAMPDDAPVARPKKVAKSPQPAPPVLKLPKPAKLAPGARPPAPVESSPDSERPPESAPPPKKTPRAPGGLVTSAEFATVWRIVHAVALRDGERWAHAPKRPGELSARIVGAAERELGTALPDDFWAAAAAGIPQFSMLGIARTPDHGEPVPAVEVGEAVLTVASDAESELDDGVVAIMDLRELGGEYDFVCVEKGVSHAHRNEQRIFLSGASGLDKRASFAKYLLLVLKELHGNLSPSAKPTEYQARLIA